MSESGGVLGKIGGTDLQKMILFMFLGLVIAILVLGFHKSPAAKASKNIGQKPQAVISSTQAASSARNFTESRIPL
jgi:ABC-type molybdate transport system permease subunit